MNRTGWRAVTVGAATLAPATVWGVSRLADTDLTVAMSNQPSMRITLPAVFFTAFAAGLAGWALLALLERFTARARTVWSAIGVAALLVSVAMPLTVDAATAVRLTLLLMHLVVGTVLIGGLRSAAATRRTVTNRDI